MNRKTKIIACYKEQAEHYKKKHQIQTANNSRSLKMVLDELITKQQKR